MTVAEALAAARTAGVARLDALVLLETALGRARTWLIAHDDAALDGAQAGAFATALARRAAGEPLAYLVGEREFHGLLLSVGPAVLVPRPETELLVDWAIELLDRSGATGLPAPRQAPVTGHGAAVVDLGTGSGAVALALAHARPAARITATDASAAALAVARENARRLGLPVEFIRGDWWRPLGGRRFELALSNPPYIAGDDPHLPALAHEPRAALTPEGDGLAALRAIVAGAPAQLAPGAWLLLEHGHDQGEAVRRLLGGRGFEAVQTRKDLAGLDRCSGGRLRG